MALSDHPVVKERETVKRRAITDKNKCWSDSQKIEAVTTYLALGDLRLTANVLKIPEITMRVWKAKDWWKEIEGELRLQEDLQLSTRLQKIINKSFDQVEDRLANGDFIYDQKTGQLVRKPVSMKDAHKVAIDLVDKRKVLIDRTPQTQSVEGIEDKLIKLAEKFAQIASSAKAPIEVTDVIFQETTAGRGTVGDGGSGANPVGKRFDNDPDGVLEGGDSSREEAEATSRKETNA